MSKSSKPTPIALPNDLIAEVEAASEQIPLSKQDIMRLAMRIGLIDLRAAQNIAGVIQQLATDKGESFLSWAKEKQQTPVRRYSDADTRTSDQAPFDDLALVADVTREDAVSAPLRAAAEAFAAAHPLAAKESPPRTAAALSTRGRTVTRPRGIQRGK